MRISVIVHPNNKRPRVERDLLNMLHVYVKEPPLEGRANEAVVQALAEYFQTKRRNVMLVSGEKSKAKIFEIELV